MKIGAIWLGMVVVIMMMSGCASTKELDINAIAKMYYGQERTYSPVRLTGVNEITIHGSNMVVELQSELSPLSIIPQDKATAGIISGAIKDTVLMGLGIYTGGQVMKELSARPQIISQQVVKPEIITVQ